MAEIVSFLKARPWVAEMTKSRVADHGRATEDILIIFAGPIHLAVSGNRSRTWRVKKPALRAASPVLAWNLRLSRLVGHGQRLTIQEHDYDAIEHMVQWLHSDNYQIATALLPVSVRVRGYQIATSRTIEICSNESKMIKIKDAGIAALITHARVYAIAKRYEMLSLMRLAEDKFRRTAKKGFRIKEFALVVREIVRLTDRWEADQLRGLLCCVCKGQLVALRNNDKFVAGLMWLKGLDVHMSDSPERVGIKLMRLLET
jgi:hypothetical protein